MKHVDTLPLFSQAVSLFDLDLDHDKILKRMKKLEYREAAVKRGKIMLEKTFAGNDYRILNSFPKLKKEVEQACYQHIQNILKMDVDFFIYSSWVTRTGSKGFTLAHSHPNTWFSGVYYPHTHSSFEIKLHNPYPPMWQPREKEDQLNIYNSNAWIFPALTGRLILFPSHVPHEILTNEASYDRYSIAFNVIPEGPIGWHDGCLNLKNK